MSASNTSPSVSTTTVSDPGDIDDNQDMMMDSKDFNVNYLFLLIALIFIIGILVTVWLTRRKRRKDARLRHNSFNALEQDVENYAARTHRGYGAWRYRLGNIGVHRAEEGLNEDGEAPPPYKSDDKSQHESIINPQTSNPIASQTNTGATGPDTIARPPPDYHNLPHTNIRPPPAVAVTAPSTVMSEIDEDMYRNAALRMRADYRSSLSTRRS